MTRNAPVIASDLGPEIDALIAAHPSRPRMLPAGPRSWEPPPEAEILLTFSSRWKDAPRIRPASWPGELQWVQAGSAGIDNFPGWFLDAPLVSCARGVQAGPIAEYVMAALLEQEKPLGRAALHGPAEWSPAPFGQLEGRDLGIAGFGAIGRAVALRAQAFGMRVTALTRGSPVRLPGVASAASLGQLAAASDHLVLCMPLTADTHHAVDAQVLGAARPGLHLVNVARGGLIDGAALLAALRSGQVGRATLDVTEPEPLPEGHPFYAMPEVRLTPHMAGKTRDGAARLARKILANLDLYLAGQAPGDLIERQRGY